MEAGGGRREGGRGIVKGGRRQGGERGRGKGGRGRKREGYYKGKMVEERRGMQQDVIGQIEI